MIDVKTLWEVLDKGGVIALAAFITIAFVKGWIVPRWAYDKLEKDCSRMTEIALRGTELAERGIQVAEKKARP